MAYRRRLSALSPAFGFSRSTDVGSGGTRQTVIMRTEPPGAGVSAAGTPSDDAADDAVSGLDADGAGGSPEAGRATAGFSISMSRKVYDGDQVKGATTLHRTSSGLD
jgi:hypothetical protein